MKRTMLFVLSLMMITVFSNEFLMIYPNGLSITGDTLTVQSDHARLEIPETWVVDSFTAVPNPVRYQMMLQNPFDYSETLKESVGKMIRWRFEDGSIKQYQLLLDDPILLSDENGVFTPQNGTAVFEQVTIQEASRYLDLRFSQVIPNMSYSYMFRNLSYATVFVMHLNEENEKAEMIGTLIVKNETQKPIQTDHLYIFSGQINTVSTDYALKAMRSFNYEADSFSGGASMDHFSDYKIYSIPGSFAFEPASTDYIPFLKSHESYHMIYTFTSQYANRNSDFQAFDQTIRIPKLSRPLMAGKIRIQKSDQDKTVFLGENTISNSNQGQPLEISFGKAYDLQGKVELIQSNRSGNTYFEAYEFTAKNYSADQKEIQLNFSIPRDSDVQVDGYDFSRPRATLIQIPLTLHANMEAEVTFEIRYDR